MAFALLWKLLARPKVFLFYLFVWSPVVFTGSIVASNLAMKAPFYPGGTPFYCGAFVILAMVLIGSAIGQALQKIQASSLYWSVPGLDKSLRKSTVVFGAGSFVALGCLALFVDGDPSPSRWIGPALLVPTAYLVAALRPGSSNWILGFLIPVWGLAALTLLFLGLALTTPALILISVILLVTIAPWAFRRRFAPSRVRTERAASPRPHSYETEEASLEETQGGAGAQDLRGSTWTEPIRTLRHWEKALLFERRSLRSGRRSLWEWVWIAAHWVFMGYLLIFVGWHGPDDPSALQKLLGNGPRVLKILSFISFCLPLWPLIHPRLPMPYPLSRQDRATLTLSYRRVLLGRSLLLSLLAMASLGLIARLTSSPPIPLLDSWEVLRAAAAGLAGYWICQDSFLAEALPRPWILGGQRNSTEVSFELLFLSCCSLALGGLAWWFLSTVMSVLGFWAEAVCLLALLAAGERLATQVVRSRFATSDFT